LNATGWISEMATIELEKPIDARRQSDLLSLEKCWASWLGDFRTPGESQFFSWLRSSDFATVLYAIEAGGKKAHAMKCNGAPMTRQNVCGYVSAVLKNRAMRRMA
jgi:hypothetical protein